MLDARGPAARLACTGTLLGVIDDPHIADTEVELEPGDTLLLYTDGLTEAGAPKHTLTHRRGRRDCWRGCAARPPQQTAQALPRQRD